MKKQPLRPLAALFALACLLLLPAGCGPSCRDACEREAECTAKNGGFATPMESCVNACEEDTSCRNLDARLECLASMRCENAAAYLGELITCAAVCNSES